ncbi:MAG: mandelate racemase, partial [Ramlibacter sp.]|nr:mandelate racemase [Ramlibacter sp.]
MADEPRFIVREIELYERPVVLRLPFRFGVVTLTECPQAFARVRIEFSDGSSAWGAAAEMMAPKWFDKNLALSNEDNFDQLRDVLKMARAAYLADGAPATAFGHFARHYDEHLQAAAA